MSAQHKAIMIVLLLTGFAIAIWRMRPQQPGQALRCPNPCGVTLEGRIIIVCLSRTPFPTSELFASLKMRFPRASPSNGERRASRAERTALIKATLTEATAIPRDSEVRREYQRARWIRRGQLIRFNEQGEMHVGMLPARTRLTLGLRLDLNRASISELVALPRIGPVLAERIVQDRQQRGRFVTLAELQRVSGIGPATIKRLQRYLIVTEP